MDKVNSAIVIWTVKDEYQTAFDKIIIPTSDGNANFSAGQNVGIYIKMGNRDMIFYIKNNTDGISTTELISFDDFRIKEIKVMPFKNMET